MVKKKISDKKTNNNLVIGIIVILLLIGVFWYFNSDKEEMEYGDSLKQSAIGVDNYEELTKKEARDAIEEEFGVRSFLVLKILMRQHARDILEDEFGVRTDAAFKKLLREMLKDQLIDEFGSGPNRINERSVERFFKKMSEEILKEMEKDGEI